MPSTPVAPRPFPASGTPGRNARAQGRLRHHAVRPEDWAAVSGQAAHMPVRAPIVSSHQEPSSLHVAREKSLNVQDEHEKKYPRQGSNL